MQSVYNKMCLFYVMREHTHDFESVVTLQNCMAILRDECGSCTGTCQTSSGDGNQFLFVNVEEFVDIEVEEDPSTSAVIKPEPAVSCVSGIMHSGQISRVFCHTVCLCLSTESFVLW